MQDAVEGSPPRVRSQSISSMSQLLLQGWAMLAECCPDCGVPLMRHPSGAPLLCVNCGRDTSAAEVADGQAGAQSSVRGGHTAAVAVEHANGFTDGSPGGTSSADGGDDPCLLQPPPPLRNRLRSELAQEEEPAPAGTALPGTLAVSSSAGLTAGGPIAPAAQPAGSSTPEEARPTSSPRHQRQTQGHGGSSAVAELMLEGWAMLADHCPRCLNPLLRSRDRSRTYCAGCQLNVVREGEERGRPAAAPSAQQPKQHEERVPPRQWGQQGSEPARLTAVRAPDTESFPLHPSPQAGAGALQQHLPAVDAAAAAVSARLEALTAALAQVSITDASKLLAEVQQCAAALQALAECRGSIAGGH